MNLLLPTTYFGLHLLMMSPSAPSAIYNPQEFSATDLDGNGLVNLVDFATLALDFGA